MLKTAATYATFLAGVSILYYVAFWWVFDVNVIPFFKIEDLLLGIIFPLRHSGLYSICSVIFIALLSALVPTKKVMPGVESEEFNSIHSELQGAFTNEKPSQDDLIFIKEKMERFKIVYETHMSKLRKWMKLTVIGLVFIAFLVLILFIYQPYSKSINALLVFTLTIAIGFAISLDKDLPENMLEISEKNKSWISGVDLTFIMLLVFLPISAVITGYSEAHAIVHAKRFNYILAKDIPSSIPIGRSKYMVYLGVINEKFILADSLNTETIILDKESFPVIRLYSFDYENNKSVALFNKLANDSLNVKIIAQDSASSKKINNSRVTPHI